MRWFRKSPLDPLAVSMTGVKLGDRLLFVGGSDTALAAALAAKAGLSGRACVLAETESAARQAAAAVERQGSLIESFAAPWTMWPFDPHAFDVVVIRGVLEGLDPESRLRAVREAHRVLRPGGRTVVIEDARRGGAGGLLGGRQHDPAYERSGGATHVLEAAGFRGVRRLAERDRQIFVEGIKAAEAGTASGPSEKG